MPVGRTFDKPALPVPDQIQLLRQRGLAIPDPARAEHYLTFISYYRFAGYCLPFQTTEGNDKHKFKSGVEFEQILSVYIFDRELRLLVMDALERIEVAIRTVLGSRMAVKYNDPHWFLRRDLFLEKYDHSGLIENIKDGIGFNEPDGARNSKKAVFIEHYLATYASPELPPIWMLCEVMSLGTWSMVFANLKHYPDRKMVSLAFNIGSPEVFESFLHCIAVLRNICAHHARLWNRVFSITPRSVFIGGFELKHNTTFYAQAAVIAKLLTPTSPNSDWATRLLLLLKKYPGINQRDMGLPLNWQKNQFWNINSEVLKAESGASS